MPLFTRENAREMSLRANFIRWHSPEPPRIPEPVPEPDPDIARVRARLDKLDELMASADSDEAWDRLSRSYERLFRCWQVLSRTPGPGQLRPDQPGKRQAKYWDKPIAALVEVQPSPAQNCGVQHTTNGMPATNPVSLAPQSAQSSESKQDAK